MIRLSDVKVRVQYRKRVRYRLMVRWRQGGLEGLVPRYPQRRGRRATDRVVELVAYARRELAYGAARTQLWLRRRHDVQIAMGTIPRIFREGAETLGTSRRADAR